MLYFGIREFQLLILGIGGMLENILYDGREGPNRLAEVRVMRSRG